MPCSYTSVIVEKSDSTFKDYAKKCITAFLYESREKSGDWNPDLQDAIKPFLNDNSYELESFNDSKKDYADFVNKSHEEKINELKLRLNKYLIDYKQTLINKKILKKDIIYF